MNDVNDVNNVSSPVRVHALGEQAATMALVALADDAASPVTPTAVSAHPQRLRGSSDRPPQPDELTDAAWLPPFIAPLTFLPACCPVLSFLSYVVGAFPERTRPLRRLHVNDVNRQQARGLAASASHKRLEE